MTTKHTPGPWHITSGLVVDANENEIAYTHGAGTSVFKPTTMDANARLIAKVPDLLRELKSALFYIETYGGEVTSNFAAGGNLQQVKALIAQAEGKES